MLPEKCRYGLKIFPHSSQHYVQLPSEEIPPILHDDCYKPFIGAQAAADGSLADACVMEEDMGRYRSRKGRISQNILAGSTFDMQICYMMTGWEGSTADGRLWEEARQRNLAIPPDWYWLGDAGFPLCETMLVPYRGKRYHLKEWHLLTSRRQRTLAILQEVAYAVSHTKLLTVSWSELCYRKAVLWE